MGLEDLYQETILFYAKQLNGKIDTGENKVCPISSSSLVDTPYKSHQFNQSCGDDITVYITQDKKDIDSGRLGKMQWSGGGCSIAMASMSMLCSYLENKTIDDFSNIYDLFKKLMDSRGEGLNDDQMEKLGDFSAFAGVSKFPARIKCALLAFEATKDTIEKLKNSI